MFGECCPECGHLLPENQRNCVYCSWDENHDHYQNFAEMGDDLMDPFPNEFRQTQLSE